MSEQNRHNPDVNTFIIDDADPGENSDRSINRDDPAEGIPVPPGTEPAAPVEEPPGTDGVPVGDVDDSPKRIA